MSEQVGTLTAPCLTHLLLQKTWPGGNNREQPSRRPGEDWACSEGSPGFFPQPPPPSEAPFKHLHLHHPPQEPSWETDNLAHTVE